jgi:hypothetical protein
VALICRAADSGVMTMNTDVIMSLNCDDFFILSKDYDIFGLPNVPKPNGNILVSEPPVPNPYWPKYGG